MTAHNLVQLFLGFVVPSSYPFCKSFCKSFCRSHRREQRHWDGGCRVRPAHSPAIKYVNPPRRAALWLLHTLPSINTAPGGFPLVGNHSRHSPSLPRHSLPSIYSGRAIERGKLLPLAPGLPAACTGTSRNPPCARASYIDVLHNISTAYLVPSAVKK